MQKFLSRLTAVLVALSLCFALALAPQRAQAMDRDVKAVIVAGSYGLLGGTLLGLATLPFTQDVRTIFLGSSLGLYLGIAVGFYYIYNRNDPGNPLGPEDDYPGYDDYESRLSPDSRERELRRLGSVGSVEFARERMRMAAVTSEPLQFSVPVFRF